TRPRQQADRARARDRREDGEDARQPRARQARGLRPNASRALRRALRPQVLGPIASGGSDRAQPTVNPCPWESSPEPRAASGGCSLRSSPGATGSWLSTPGEPNSSANPGPAWPASSPSPATGLAPTTAPRRSRPGGGPTAATGTTPSALG